MTPGAAFEWGLDGLRHLGPEADAVVIVDVLSFSTAVTVAVECGAAVLVHEEPGALVAVNRRRMDDAHPWSLSPVSLRALSGGSRLFLPSPNGSTLSAEADALGCRTVLAGCLRNASAVGELARRTGRRIAVIAAGERWPSGGLRPAVEDLLGAGAVLHAMAPVELTPEAEAAVAAFTACRDLSRILRGGTSGRQLIEAGFAEDVDIAAELDASQAVPLLRDGAYGAG